jgi:hypothetical protein
VFLAGFHDLGYNLSPWSSRLRRKQEEKSDSLEAPGPVIVSLHPSARLAGLSQAEQTPSPVHRSKQNGLSTSTGPLTYSACLQTQLVLRPLRASTFMIAAAMNYNTTLQVLLCPYPFHSDSERTSRLKCQRSNSGGGWSSRVNFIACHISQPSICAEGRMEADSGAIRHHI